jgi:hypothetical protein
MKKRQRRATGDTATYVYCVVKSARAPSCAKAPPGLVGVGRPRSCPAGRGLWLVVADAPLARYGEAAINARLQDLDWVSTCALAHEAVVEHFLEAGTVVPMKLYTLFASDARAAAYVERSRSRIARIVKRVAGCREWGVRVLFPLERLRTKSSPVSKASGTAFLASKRQRRDEVVSAVEEAAARAETLFAALAKRSVASHRNPPPPQGATPPVLDAAFLVPVKGAPRFRSAVEEAAKGLESAGCNLSLTGPWPPYNFIEAR